MKKKIYLFVLFSICMLAITPVFAYKCPNNLDYVGCGSGANAVTGIPAIIPRLVSFAITLMKVIIPVALVVTGTIEMFKSIIAGNPDNIPKGKKRIINKFVGALLAFFIISFTTNIVKLIAKRNERSTLAACLSCYLNNNCNDNKSACTDVNDKEIGGDSNDGEVVTQPDNESKIEQREDDSTNNSAGFNPGSTGTTTTTTTPTTTPTTTSNPDVNTTDPNNQVSADQAKSTYAKSQIETMQNSGVPASVTDLLKTKYNNSLDSKYKGKIPDSALNSMKI